MHASCTHTVHKGSAADGLDWATLVNRPVFGVFASMVLAAPTHRADVVIFVTVVRDGAHAVSSNVNSLTAYANALAGHDLQLFVYEDGSKDATRAMWIAGAATLQRTGLFSRASVGILPTVGPNAAAQLWPARPNGEPCASGNRACRIAAVRESSLRHLRATLAGGHTNVTPSQACIKRFNASDALEVRRHGGGQCGWVVVFDGDLFALPTAASVAQAMAFGRTHRAGAIFAFGEEIPGGNYYDTFATVNAAGRFMVVPPAIGLRVVKRVRLRANVLLGSALGPNKPVDERRAALANTSARSSLPVAPGFFRVRSGFGGMGIYDAAAYLSSGCSYIRPSGHTLRHYSKWDSFARRDNVYGWVCEHTAMNACLSRAAKAPKAGEEGEGLPLFLSHGMHLARASGSRRNGGVTTNAASSGRVAQAPPTSPT